MPPLFHELKRRRVFRVAGVYAVVAWIVIEAADVLVPGLALPEWIVTAVIIMALLGFPVAVVLAWAFELTPEGMQRAPTAVPAGTPTAAASATRSSFRLQRGPWFVLGFLVALTGAWMMMSGGEPEPLVELDDDVVVVLPFRTAGADPQLSYLREGMIDLFAATLTGEMGPRAMDSRTVLAAWRGRSESEDADLTQSDALALTAGLGAGRLLLGEAVGTPSRVTLSASILDARTGAVAARARVEGSVDSLPALVDRLAATLVSLGAGESQQRATALADVPLSALRHYLDAQSAYRRGRYGDAVQGFQQALQVDSTFALAALGLASAAGWSANDLFPEGLRLAHAAGSRLSPQDRAYLDALAGPDFPDESSADIQLEAAERAVRIAPDRPEAWYILGDQFFHWGRALGLPDPEERAAEAFRRALAFDSTFTPPLQHLVELAAGMGDTATVRRLGVPYLARDTAGETSDYLGWRVAMALNDTTALRAAIDQLETRSRLGLLWINGAIQNEALAPQDAARARQALFDRATEDRRTTWANISVFQIDLNRGRPGDALRHLEGAMAAAPAGALDGAAAWTDILTVFGAQYAGMDSTAAVAAVGRLAERAASPATDGPHGAIACTVGQWAAWRGDLEGGRRALEWLAAAADDEPAVVGWCRALLEAIDATAGEMPDAAQRVRRLDALTRTAPPLGGYGEVVNPNLAVARLLEAVGDREAALTAVRRGWRRGLPPNGFRAVHLREEGRLAAATGDTAGAIRAYRDYLTLRPDPEPSVRPEVERVRRELARLVNEGARP